MKKLFLLSIALITSMTIAINATSLNQSPDSQKKEKIEKKDRKEPRKDRGNRDFRAQRNNPFEGIELTDAQKADFKKLKEEQKVAPKQAECCKDTNAACCQGEGKSCCWQLTPEQQKAAAAERLNKIKNILTPEQYQEYLENVAIAQQVRQKAPTHGNTPRDGRKPRAPRQQKPQQSNTN